MEADQAWRLLIEKNSDCLQYFYELFKMKNLPLVSDANYFSVASVSMSYVDAVSEDNREQTVALLLELSAQYPRSSVPVRFYSTSLKVSRSNRLIIIL